MSIARTFCWLFVLLVYAASITTTQAQFFGYNGFRYPFAYGLSSFSSNPNTGGDQVYLFSEFTENGF